MGSRRHMTIQSVTTPSEARLPLVIMAMENKENSKYHLRPETIIISGFSRLPENISAKHVFGYFSIELEVDPVDGKIVDFSCTLLPFLGEKILHSALLGYTVEVGINNAVQQLERRFYSATKRAVIAALEDAYKWYRNNVEKEK